MSRNINITIVIILRDIVDNSTIALSIIDVCCVMMRNRYRKERLDINMLTLLYSTLACNILFQHLCSVCFCFFFYVDVLCMRNAVMYYSRVGIPTKYLYQTAETRYLV